ncbi:MAG TPA: hypothetical protein PKI59_05490 [Candidatus Cloacimonadota bacterium]|nr:hypothetical protein [Candidatus Cloacimonadota bacterium]
MNLSTEEISGQVWFRIDAAEARYIPVLQMCYYQEDERGFYKHYPADYPYMDRIRQNFVQHGLDLSIAVNRKRERWDRVAIMEQYLAGQS